MRKILFLLVIYQFNFSQCIAQTLAECFGNEGYGYFFETPFSKKSDAGWHKDGITNGRFNLIKSNNEYDILFIDATGRLVSAKADNGEVFLLNSDADSYTILVVYPGLASEVYHFDLNAKIYSLSSNKFGASIVPKASVYIGSCI